MSEIKETAATQEAPIHRSKILIALAKVASYVFHPVFMPTVMAYVLFMLSHDTGFAGVTDKAFKMWLLIIAINTLFFPLLTILLLKGLGFLNSIQMKESKDRIIPLIACMIFYFWANHALGSNPEVHIPLILHTLTLGSFWGIIVIFMVSIFYKVSMHSAAAGGMIGILLVLMFTSNVNMVFPFFVALFIAGLIGTARMILKAHQIWEVWIGYVLGILVQVAAYFYLAP